MDYEIVTHNWQLITDIHVRAEQPFMKLLKLFMTIIQVLLYLTRDRTERTWCQKDIDGGAKLLSMMLQSSI